MEFNLIDNYKLSIVRSGKKYKITLVVPPARKPVPIRTLGKVFWFDWLRNKSFMAELAEKVGCAPNDLVAPLGAISSELELKGGRILEPPRPPKKTEPDRKVVDISLLDDEGRFEFVAPVVADKITGKDRFITHRKSHVIWVYTKGLYTDDGEEIIREGVRALLGDEAKEAWVNEVVAHITETTYTYPEKFEAPVDLVNLKNGILNIKTGELMPHTPDIIFINELPVNYDPQKQCPKIMKFLSEILDLGDILVVQEIVGYCLLRKYPFARATMLLGGGANGKSTLLNLIAALLGEENIATPSLQDLLENRFSKGDLFGKLANIHADIPSSELVSTGIFKMLTGQDLMWADVKHKKAFKFRNYAKLLYSANELPETEDMSEAFWRRWIIIKFTRVFPEGDPKTDPHILEKLIAPEELSGFLNWALEGLHRLLKQGHFTRTEAWVDVEREWIRRTDSLRAFVNEKVRVKQGGFTTKADFYEKYKGFCAEYDIDTVTMSAVGHRLPSIIPQTGEIKPKVDKKQQKAWKDIYITDSTDNLTTFAEIIEEKIDEKKKDNIHGERTQKNRTIGDTGAQTAAETASKQKGQTVSDLKRRLFEAFGVNPFKPSQLSEHFSDAEIVRLSPIMDDMLKRGEMWTTPLESGQYAFRLVMK